MATDIETEVFFNAVTMAAGTVSGALNHDMMDRFAVAYSFTSPNTGAVAGFNMHLQWSIDGAAYYPLSGSTVTSVNTGLLQFSDVSFNYVRAITTLTAGEIVATVKIRSLGIK